MTEHKEIPKYLQCWFCKEPTFVLVRIRNIEVFYGCMECGRLAKYEIIHSTGENFPLLFQRVSDPMKQKDWQKGTDDMLTSVERVYETRWDCMSVAA